MNRKTNSDEFLLLGQGEWHEAAGTRRSVAIALPTFEERETLKRRLVKQDAVIDGLRLSFNEVTCEEWAAIYAERKAIEKRLGVDS
jgi:hypothetical protein